MSENENINSPETAPTEKKPWITPTATAEQVSEVTNNSLGAGGDAISCHS